MQDPGSTAEAAVVAAAIMRPELVAEAGLVPGDFGDSYWGRCWEQILDLTRNAAGPVDPVLIAERGGQPVEPMVKAITQIGTGQNLAWYAAQVRNSAVERRAKSVVAEHMGCHDQGDAWVLGLIEKLRGIELPDVTAGVHIKDGVLDAVKSVEAAIEWRRGGKAGDLDRIGSGLSDLDLVLGGIRRGVVCVVGARPSVGKSSLLATIARNVALTNKSVDIYSIEDCGRSLFMRLLCQEAQVIGSMATDGRVDDADMARLTAAASRLYQTNVLVDDRVPSNLDRFLATVERNATRRKTELVVIDYLQLLSPGHRGNQSRDSELGEVSRGIARVVRRLNCACLVAAQLNRSAESEEPSLAHLRECGSIEADADCVVLLDDLRWCGGRPTDDQGQLPVTVAKINKNKHGRTGKVLLRWTPRYTLFEDATQEDKDRWAAASVKPEKPRPRARQREWC